MNLKLQFSLPLSLALCLVPNFLQIDSVGAQQITSDGTTGTTVTSDGNNFTIQDGTRNGGNLFHSFQDFSVPTGGSAFFNNGNDISNILSRVTGGNLSNIDGLIRANGSANLFLINPAGIIFGEGASLNIGGSFYGSTADSILFDDGEFSAVNNLDAPILTINAPIGLNFRDNPSDIVTNGTENAIDTANFSLLAVTEDQSLNLIGGNVDLNNTILSAPGGNIELGGLQASGTVSINENGGLSFPENIARGDISLDNSQIFADFNFADFSNDGEGGSINLNANNIELLNASLLQTGIDADLGFDGAQAGDINLNATGAINISGGGGIFNLVGAGGTGNAGNININANSLAFSQAQISSNTLGEGKAGDITLNVTESFQATEGSFLQSDTFGEGDAGNISINGETASITFDGLNPETSVSSGIFSLVNNFVDPNSGQEFIGSGNSGQIKLNANSLSLANGAQIRNSLNPSVVGQGNNIDLTAKAISLSGASSIISGVDTGAIGNAGDITINVTESFQANGGSILQSDTFGEGDAGNITINGETASITLDGLDPETNTISPTGITSSVRNFSNPDTGQQFTGSRNSGQIKLNADSLSLANGAQIRNSLDPSVVGQGNNIDLTAKAISLSGASSIISGVDTGAIGNGGDITLNVTESFQANGGSFLQSDTFGEGDAGNITVNGETASITFDGINPETNISSGIFSSVRSNENLDVIESRNSGQIKLNADSLSLANGAQIRNSLDPSVVGQGNNIDLTAKTISLFGASSIISGVDTGAIGNAGDITLNVTESFQANGGSVLQSDTFGEGDAGNITINGETASITLDGLDPETNIISPTGITSSVRNFSNPDTGQQFTGSRNSGQIKLNADSLSLANGAQIRNSLDPSVVGQGNNIDLTAKAISLSGASSIISGVDTGAIGNGGDITLNVTESLQASGGSSLQSDTFGEGDAGNITVNGETASITFDGINPETNGSSGIFSLVNIFVDNSGQQFIGRGKGGRVSISATNLSIANGAVINAGTFGEGDGGSILVNSSESITLDGATPDGQFVSGIGSAVAAGAKGKGGGVDVTTTNLSIADAAVINAGTSGEGDGGSILVNASESITLNGATPDGQSGSGIFNTVAAGAKGKGGGINVITTNLSIADGAVINAGTFGEGDGGSILVNAIESITLDGTTLNGQFVSGIGSAVAVGAKGKGGGVDVITTNLSITNGAAINAGTSGEGDGGSILVNASESITLDGITPNEFSSGIGSSVEIGAIGNGGSVEINTPNLIIANGAGIFASTEGEGNGGDITLNISDRLTLRENSSISVEASEPNTNGGDITINAADGFVVAFPNESEGNGSDISAFSRGGEGGNIIIEAQGVLGIEERDATLGNNTNDIDASGTIEDGSVEITSATTDAIQGVNQLPSIPVEAGETVVQACSAQRGIANSNLVIKGKGGVPNSPDAILSSEIIRINGEAINSQSLNREDIQPISTSKGEIILARGVEITEDGGIVLTAYKTDHSSRNPQQSVNCN